MVSAVWSYGGNYIIHCIRPSLQWYYTLLWYLQARVGRYWKLRFAIIAVRWLAFIANIDTVYDSKNRLVFFFKDDNSDPNYDSRLSVIAQLHINYFVWLSISSKTMFWRCDNIGRTKSCDIIIAMYMYIELLAN